MLNRKKNILPIFGFFLILGLALIDVTPAWARGSACPKYDEELKPGVQVYHYPQTHWANKSLSASHVKKILLSQYCLLTFLKKHPEFEVFEEAFTEDFDYASYFEYISHKNADDKQKTESHFRIARALIEKSELGIEALSSEETTWLTQYSAVEAALGSKWISLVHKIGDADKLIGIYTEIKNLRDSGESLGEIELKKLLKFPLNTQEKRLLALIHTGRERLAASEVFNYLEANPSKRALIVFGAAHDFKESFEALKVPFLRLSNPLD